MSKIQPKELDDVVAKGNALADDLRRYRHKYYNESNPEVSDAVYDSVE